VVDGELAAEHLVEQPTCHSGPKPLACWAATGDQPVAHSVGQLRPALSVGGTQDADAVDEEGSRAAAAAAGALVDPTGLASGTVCTASNDSCGPTTAPAWLRRTGLGVAVAAERSAVGAVMVDSLEDATDAADLSWLPSLVAASTQHPTGVVAPGSPGGPATRAAGLRWPHGCPARTAQR
jgi:hypothetical protein